MNKKELESFAREAAKGIKTEQDIAEITKVFRKAFYEKALNIELDEHLGYSKHDATSSSNSRNGYSSKTMLSEDGSFALNTPRDRQDEFEPQLIKKRQTRITSMDSKILSLYAKGMSTREIVVTFEEMYDADVSPSLISRVTDGVLVVEIQT